MNDSAPLLRTTFKLPDTPPEARALDENGTAVQTGKLIAYTWMNAESAVIKLDPAQRTPEWPTPVARSSVKNIRVPIHGQPTIIQVREFSGPLTSEGQPQSPTGVAQCMLADGKAPAAGQCTYTLTNSDITIHLNLKDTTNYFVVFGQWYMSKTFNKKGLQADNLASWSFSVN